MALMNLQEACPKLLKPSQVVQYCFYVWRVRIMALTETVLVFLQSLCAKVFGLWESL